jgi:hypothetical protein
LFSVKICFIFKLQTQIMKKLLLLGSLLITISATSQVFTPVTNDSTFYGVATDNDFYGDIPIGNDDGTNSSMYWEVDSVNLPAGWEFSVCDPNICYPIGTQNVEWSLPANGGYLNMHYYPNGQEGEGFVILRVNDSPNQNQIEYMTFRANATTSGIATSSLEEVSLYPNPANELINITGGSANTKFEMLDILGNKIKTGKLDINGNHKINTSSVLNGVYFIVLMEKGQKVTRKIIVH